MPVLLLREAERVGSLDPGGQRILGLLEQDLASDEALEEVVEALRIHPVLGQTRDLARAWAQKAVEALEDLPESDAKDSLEAFAMMMVDRAV